MAEQPTKAEQFEQLTAIALSAARLIDHERTRKAAHYINSGLATWAVVKQVQAFIEQRRSNHRRKFVLSVGNNDHTYGPLLGWLLDQIPDEKRTSLAVSTFRRGFDDDDEVAEPVSMRYDGAHEITTQVDGHKVAVAAIQQQLGDGGRTIKPASITFTTESEAGRDAVLGLIKSFVDNEPVYDPPRLYAPSRFGWNLRSDLPLRDIETVILRSGQREDLVEDLQRFLDSEERYAKLGVPWHRGYCLYGPPGTGKTSLGRALASHFGLSVYYLPLNDLRDDTNLMELFRDLPERCILLLEDVDSVHAAVSREDEGGRLSISGLLNALDGVVTPRGMITIMTTNDFESLDPALVRPGRMDRAEELGYLDDESLGRMLTMLLGESVAMPKMTASEVTPSDVLGVFLRHMDHPDTFPDALRELVAPGKGLKLVA